MLNKIIATVIYKSGSNKGTVAIPPDMVGYVIGKKGRRIGVLQRYSGTNIRINKQNQAIIEGSPAAVALASTFLHVLLGRVRVGDILTGRVKKKNDFCAFIDLGNENYGSLHVAHMPKGMLEKLNIGETLSVRVKEIDSRYILEPAEKYQD